MGIAKSGGGDETSGLYDLKELASSAKKRRSQRLSSEMDAQNSLLQSSAALEAVALPDPKKSQQIAIPVVTLDSASGANTTKIKHSAAVGATAMSLSEVPSPRSSKGWMLAGIALLAVAGGAAFMLLNGQNEATTASSNAASAAGAAGAEIPTPVQTLPAIVTEQEEANSEAPSEEPVVAALDTESEEPEVTTTEQAKPAVSEGAKAEKTEKNKQKNSENKAESKSGAEESQDGEKKLSKAEIRAAAKAAKAEEKAAAKAEAKANKTKVLDENSSVDDILSSVTGGIETKEVVAEDKGPSKKRLERGDFAKAMKSVSPKAKACYSAEEFSGVVTVKYSVAPDGSVSGVQATGAHKSSKTGACVASAVRSASFPAFSGAAMSSSFPFLLSP